MSGSHHASRTSFANKIRKAAKESRNLDVNQPQVAGGIQPGQLENTEEILRKHYFMAKATQKTQHSVLQKPESPQKHMIKLKKAKGLPKV